MSVKLFRFDEGADLDLIPLAALRALDFGGFKLSLEGWRSLSLEARLRIAELGSADQIRQGELVELLGPAQPRAVSLPPAPPGEDPGPPPHVLNTYPEAGRLAQGVWQGLSRIERYALVKIADSPDQERHQAAWQEIVGSSALSTHLTPEGAARMVRVSGKQATLRIAAAQSEIRMSAQAFQKLRDADAPKGDVLGTSRIAGIMAAKRTSELIPLCHPLSLTRVQVDFEPNAQKRSVVIKAEVEAFDRTGVEMEALVAASAAALTIYDMLKSFDRSMEIGPTHLLAKSGGRSGEYQR